MIRVLNKGIESWGDVTPPPLLEFWVYLPPYRGTDPSEFFPPHILLRFLETLPSPRGSEELPPSQKLPPREGKGAGGPSLGGD